MNVHDSKIVILPPSVTEKIAAGEVVERPASVVKELVENCIDAGATRIEIHIEDAGFSCIRISDNGSGIGPGDLQKCVLRHATSKISSADDLYSISTLGFRGEALASISAVSRMTITSSTADDGLGHEIRCEDNTVRDFRPARHTRGTTVVCRDLFYNVPARKKFMKSRNAERMALLRFVEQLVVPYPGVHFSLWLEGAKALEAPVASTPLERIAQVAGPEFARQLVRCTGENNGLAATIFISPPEHATPRPRHQYLYVNLRRVDSDQVTYGIREAFAAFLTQQLRPSWFCFLDVDPEHVDVNVHPTKQRIKFDDEKRVFGFVYRTIQASLPQSLGVPPPGAAGHFHDLTAGRVPGSGPSGRPSVMENVVAPAARARDDAVQTSISFLSLASKAGNSEKELDFPFDSKVKLPQEQWELISCYQIHRLFILAPIKNGILLIDQHAAHERVLYEQALQELKSGKAPSQRLLFPIVMELSVAEKSALMTGRESFTALGFDIQDFGGRSIAVSALPASGMRESGVEEVVREMIGFLLDEKDPAILSNPHRRYAAAFACGAAIKAGQELKQEEMNSLLNSLFATECPYVCPHGRPTVVRISLDELARRFLR
jgi:DNA mismatch repair protein MutL